MVITKENPLGFAELGQSDEIELTPRDSNILQAIQEEGLTVFAFDGLKRLLGVHQEMLSRVLDRLEDEGLLEKVSEGYRLTTRGNQPIARPLNSITEEDIIQNDTKTTENYLSIDAKVGEEKDVSQAVKASHQLMGHISRLYGGPRRGRNMLTPVGFYPDMSFA